MPEEELRQGLGLGTAPIVLSVSAKRPHKNLERLIDAVAAIETEPAPILVITGYPTAYEEGLRAQAGSRVRLAGWVDDATLAGLYRMAICLVFPSLAEGFGLPVLEAMRRGLPVACSNASSLPEVAGEAALYFDPTDTASITAPWIGSMGDRRCASSSAHAGEEQARKFSWSATAARTLESYQRALAAARS